MSENVMIVIVLTYSAHLSKSVPRHRDGAVIKAIKSLFWAIVGIY